MIRSLLEIISKQSVRRSEVHRLSLTDPLRRFNDSHFGQFQLFKSIAKGIANHTNIMVESLLSDEAIPDWKSVGDCATPQQIADLSIFCSDCLVQFAIKDLKRESPPFQLNAGLIADIFDLVRVMYGEFATGDTIARLTFEGSLESRDINDPPDIIYLTRLLDQLVDIPQQPGNSHRDAKIQKLQKVFREHQRALAYTLHSVL